MTEGGPPLGFTSERVEGLGDRAIRWSGAFSEDEQVCLAKFSQRRVSVSVRTTPGPSGCPFDRLEELGARIARRLP